MGVGWARAKQDKAAAAFAQKAERARRKGDAERAVQICQEGLAKFPEHLSGRVTLGWALIDLGRFDDARAELESVLRRAPDNLAAIRGLATLHDRSESAVLDMDMPEGWHDGELVETGVAGGPAADALADAATNHAREQVAEVDEIAPDLITTTEAALAGADDLTSVLAGFEADLDVPAPDAPPTSSPAHDADATARAEAEEEAAARAAEEARQAEEEAAARAAEEARQAEEEAAARAAEEARKAREEAAARAAEEARKAEEAAAARAAEEARKAQEEAEARAAEEARKAEEARVAEEARRAELEAEVRAAEEARQAREEAEARAAEERRAREAREAELEAERQARAAAEAAAEQERQARAAVEAAAEEERQARAAREAEAEAERQAAEAAREVERLAEEAAAFEAVELRQAAQAGAGDVDSIAFADFGESSPRDADSTGSEADPLPATFGEGAKAEAIAPEVHSEPPGAQAADDTPLADLDSPLLHASDSADFEAVAASFSPAAEAAEEAPEMDLVALEASEGSDEALFAQFVSDGHEAGDTASTSARPTPALSVRKGKAPRPVPSALKARQLADLEALLTKVRSRRLRRAAESVA